MSSQPLKSFSEEKIHKWAEKIAHTIMSTQTDNFELRAGESEDGKILLHYYLPDIDDSRTIEVVFDKLQFVFAKLVP